LAGEEKAVKRKHEGYLNWILAGKEGCDNDKNPVYLIGWKEKDPVIWDGT